MSLNDVATPPIIVCERPVEFEFCTQTNMFYVTDPALSVRRAFPPALMQQCIASAARCYSEFRTAKSAEVIQFPVAETG